MRNLFPEYYHISEEKIKQIWSSGIIVLDTNVLLDFYRLPKETSDDLFGVIGKYANRVWIPYQVALEFYRNRLDVVSSLQSNLRSLREVLEKSQESIRNYLQQNIPKHPYVDGPFINKELNRSYSRIFKAIDDWERLCPSCQVEDDILIKISELFAGKVGLDLNPDQLEAIYKEGNKRFIKKIPPGFIDVQKKRKGQKEEELDDRVVYGDLIIWTQMMEFAQKNKVNILFITNDAKEDWWRIVDGKTIGPREELIREFYKTTNQVIHFYNVNRFLMYAKDNEGINIKDNTINDISEVDRYKKLFDVISESAIGKTSDLSQSLSSEVVERYQPLASSVGKSSRRLLLDSYLNSELSPSNDDSKNNEGIDLIKKN